MTPLHAAINQARDAIEDEAGLTVVDEPTAVPCDEGVRVTLTVLVRRVDLAPVMPLTPAERRAAGEGGQFDRDGGAR